MNINKRFLIVAGLAAMTWVGACAKQEAKTAKSADLKSIYFDFDSSNIQSGATSTLKSNAEYMKKHGKKNLAISGHCDERGTAEYNIALGDRRARAAKNFLVNAGVDAGRLSTISYGEEKPAANCHDESCWSKNRRDDFSTK